MIEIDGIYLSSQDSVIDVQLEPVPKEEPANICKDLVGLAEQNKSDKPKKKGIPANVYVVDGKFHSVHLANLMKHPQRNEIMKLIENKPQNHLTFDQLRDKIKSDYSLYLSNWFIRTFYLQNYTGGEHKFMYKEIDAAAKYQELMTQFTKTNADLETEREARLLDFQKEVARGASIRDSWRRGETIAKHRADVLKLGQEVGIYPKLNVAPTLQVNTQVNTTSVSNVMNLNPRIVTFFERALATLKPNGNSTTIDTPGTVSPDTPAAGTNK